MIQISPDSIADRFMRYVRIDTQSDPTSTAHPTTEKQKDLSKLLLKELYGMGITDASTDEYGYVYATIPSNSDKKNIPVICFCAHVDTAPDCSGTNVKPILHRYFDGKENSFDLLLLGMGDDGHTLSLFPGTEIVNETKHWCVAFYLKQQDMFRITITKSIANKSACILFLTTGQTKAPALKEVLHGKVNINLYPAQTIQPEAGELHWIIDKAAAGD